MTPLFSWLKLARLDVSANCYHRPETPIANRHFVRRYLTRRNLFPRAAVETASGYCGHFHGVSSRSLHAAISPAIWQAAAASLLQPSVQPAAMRAENVSLEPSTSCNGVSNIKNSRTIGR